jgi:lysyl-tRNA synthetase class 2
LSAYPNDFSRSHVARQLVEQHGSADAAALDRLQATATVAGRLAARRELAGETLATIEDGSGAMQICVSDAASGASNHAEFRQWNLGDIVGAMGILYRSPDDELTLRAHELRRLVKALRPISDQSELRRLVPMRSRVLAGIRDSMRGTQYMEVETPLLHLSPDAAAGGVLETYHNALDLKLYLRSAAGLHLQQLIIGGIEKVYEINRSFRNAQAAQPAETTTMEIYCAYANHSYMMTLLERVIAHASAYALGGTAVAWQGRQLDFAPPYARAASAHNATEALFAPTFVVEFPSPSVPRARPRDQDPALAEYFRLFAGGEPLAEGFSVRNDPEAKMGYDADFTRALEYGMPPTAGARLDIERLVELLSGRAALLSC